MKLSLCTCVLIPVALTLKFQEQEQAVVRRGGAEATLLRNGGGFSISSGASYEVTLDHSSAYRQREDRREQAVRQQDDQWQAIFDKREAEIKKNHPVKPRTAFCISGNIREGHQREAAQKLRQRIDQIDPNGLVFAYVNPCPSQTEPWWWRLADHTDAGHPKWGFAYKGEPWVPPQCVMKVWESSSFVSEIKPHQLHTYNETDVAPHPRQCWRPAEEWPEGAYQMFAGWRGCWEMIQEYEQQHGAFEAIVRMRPDACRDPEQCGQVEYCPIETLDTSKIHMHSFGQDLTGPQGRTYFNDNFAIFPRRSAWKFFTAGDDYEKCRTREEYPRRSGALEAVHIFNSYLSRLLQDEDIVDHCDCHMWKSSGNCASM
eukprot:TRINITY_DN17438_c0_g1_i1.p1 TRINITY_DN17438_c0_g1~~TRINITY_DN17438_c0_g1_i1.p1  ORF type:complete len:372 (+),score=61.33 TRINITY_DN17438_c0_g1_i1:72-1187(+)